MRHRDTARGPAGAALAAALLCAGCAIQSPPSGEQIRADALGSLDVRTPFRGSGSSDAPLQDRWIERFNDPQLNAIVAEALAHNPDLRIAAAAVQEASESLKVAAGLMKPQLNLAGVGGIKLSDLGSALTGLVALVSWEIDIWGQLRYGRAAAAETLEAVRDDEEFARQSLAAMTARAWFTATQTLLEQRLAEETVASAEKLLALAQDRQRVGAGNDVETQSADIFLGSQRDTVVQAQFAHGAAVRALELLLGRYPATELRAAAELPKLEGPVPAGLPLTMLERRPDLRAAERRVAVAFNRVGQAKAQALPNVRLTGNFGYIASDVVELKNDFQNPSGGVGAKLNWPLYTGGVIEGQAGIESARQREAVAQYTRLALRAIGDVETALATTQMLSNRERLLLASAALQTRVLDSVVSAYRVGSRDRRSVEQQQLDLYTTQLGLLRVRSEQLMQRIALHLALGGSFVERAETVGAR